MSITKFFRGVVELSTFAGRRYARPTTWERVRLMWTFRNFKILSYIVLSHRQQLLVKNLCTRSDFANPEMVDETTVIGTIELNAAPLRRPQAAHRLTSTSRAS